MSQPQIHHFIFQDNCDYHQDNLFGLYAPDLHCMVALKSKTGYWYIEITAAFLVLLFVYTGLTKLTDMNFFKGQLEHNTILKGYENAIAWVVPLTELVLSVLLIIPKTRALGFLLGGALMALFSGYVGWMLFSESKLPCSCGGIIAQMSWKHHLWFNCIATGSAFYAWHLHRTKKHLT